MSNLGHEVGDVETPVALEASLGTLRNPRVFPPIQIGGNSEEARITLNPLSPALSQKWGVVWALPIGAQPRNPTQVIAATPRPLQPKCAFPKSVLQNLVQSTPNGLKRVLNQSLRNTLGLSHFVKLSLPKVHLLNGIWKVPTGPMYPTESGLEHVSGHLESSGHSSVRHFFGAGFVKKAG